MNWKNSDSVEMPPRRLKKPSKKVMRPKPALRKRIGFPNANIVALNLAKCFDDSLLNLMTKLKLVRNKQKRIVTKKQSQVIDKFILLGKESALQLPMDPSDKGVQELRGNFSSSKKPPQKFTSVKTRRRFKSLGKRFINDFEYFAKFGDKYVVGNTISYPNTLRWLKKAKVVDYKRISIPDVEIHFINALKSGHELKILEFIRFLKMLCEERGLHMSAMVIKLLKCRKQKKGTGKNLSTSKQILQKEHKHKPLVKEKVINNTNIIKNGDIDGNATILSSQPSDAHESKDELHSYNKELESKSSQDINLQIRHLIHTQGVSTSSKKLRATPPDLTVSVVTPFIFNAKENLIKKNSVTNKNNIDVKTTNRKIQAPTFLHSTSKGVQSNAVRHTITIKKIAKFDDEVIRLNEYKSKNVSNQKVIKEVTKQSNSAVHPLKIDKIRKQASASCCTNLKSGIVTSKTEIKKGDHYEFINSEISQSPLPENLHENRTEIFTGARQKNIANSQKCKILSSKQIVKPGKINNGSFMEERDKKQQPKISVAQSSKSGVGHVSERKLHNNGITTNNALKVKSSAPAGGPRSDRTKTNENLSTTVKNSENSPTNKNCGTNKTPEISQKNIKETVKSKKINKSVYYNSEQRYINTLQGVSSRNKMINTETSKRNMYEKNITTKKNPFCNIEQKNIRTYQANYNANRTILTKTSKENVEGVKRKNIKRKNRISWDTLQENIDAVQANNSHEGNVDNPKNDSVCIKQEDIQDNEDVEEIQDNKVVEEILENSQEPLTIKKKRMKKIPRTFTNLPARYVEKCIQKSQNLKMKNNLMEHTNIKSPPKKTIKKHKEKIATYNTSDNSKLPEILPNATTNNLRETDNINVRKEFREDSVALAPDTSSTSALPELQKNPRKKKIKKGKVHKIRKSVKKKEMEDPKTQTQK